MRWPEGTGHAARRIPDAPSRTSGYRESNVIKLVNRDGPIRVFEVVETAEGLYLKKGK